MALTRERIESLAPDQSSLSAALKLTKPTTWPVLQTSSDGALLWGECQGSGSSPYRVVVSPDDVGYKCTCPSRKFPCKHVLAVLWLKVDKPERFEPSPPPQWVVDWTARRRPGSGRPPGKPAGDEDPATPKAAPSLDAALEDEVAPEKSADPKAVARAAAHRERQRAERETAVADGLDELDRWTLDQLAQGMAGFTQRSQAAIGTVAKRLTDGKAGGLAGKLEAFPTELFRYPENERADVAIERLSALALIAAAYRNQHHLPAGLREDARRAVGWTLRREDLLADTDAPRVEATWIVGTNLSEVQPDKLRRLETWLINASPADGQPRVAVLIDFVPVSGGAFGFPFEPMQSIEGEVVFFPSAAPLRGLLASRKEASATVSWPQGHQGLGPALDAFADHLAALPWLDAWPLVVDGLQVRTVGKGRICLADATGARIPLWPTQADAMLPLVGLDDVSMLLTWDGRMARVLAAETLAGRWFET